MKLDKKRIYVIYAIGAGIILLGVAIYCGLNYEINWVKKNNIINNQGQNNQNQIAQGYEIRQQNSKMTFINLENNYQITLPDSYNPPEVSNLSELIFMLPEKNTDGAITEGSIIQIRQLPADLNLSLLDNIVNLYGEFSNYEELEVNGQPAILAEQIHFGVDRTTFMINEDTAMMYIIDGLILSPTENSTFNEDYLDIINTFKINN